MRSSRKISLSLIAVAIFLSSVGGYGQSRDYWELVNTKTNLILGDGTIRSLNTDDLSKITDYESLILRGLGCPSGSQVPCKLKTLYIDLQADGTPRGRSLAGAIVTGLGKDGRVKIVASRKGSDAFFVCHSRLTALANSAYENYKRKERAEEEAREKAIEAQIARTAGDVLRQLKSDRLKGKQERYVAYVVQSDCSGEADLTYSTGPGQTEQVTTTSPWVGFYPYLPGTNYYLLAQKRDGSSTCSIGAEIYSLRLTKRQGVDFYILPSKYQISYVRAHGVRLRGADSSAGFGIASVSW